MLHLSLENIITKTNLIHSKIKFRESATIATSLYNSHTKQDIPIFLNLTDISSFPSQSPVSKRNIKNITSPPYSLCPSIFLLPLTYICPTPVRRDFYLILFLFIRQVSGVNKSPGDIKEGVEKSKVSL